MRLGPHAVCHHPEQLSPGGDYVWPGLEVGFLGFFLSMKREGAGFLTMVAPDGGVGRGEGRGDDELPVLSSSASWSAREAPFGVSSGFLGVMNVAREGVRELLAVRGREGMEGGGTSEELDTIWIDGEGTAAGAGGVLAAYSDRTLSMYSDNPRPRVFPEKVSAPYIGMNGFSCAKTVPAGN